MICSFHFWPGSTVVSAKPEGAVLRNRRCCATCCKDHVRASGGQFLFFEFEEEEGAERGVAFPEREGEMMIRMKAVSGYKSYPSHRLLLTAAWR
jgi:hypothetical protein